MASLIHPTPPAPRRIVLVGLLTGLILAWGFNYLVIRVGLATSPPLWLATYRAGVGALGVLAFVALRHAPKRLDAAGRRDALLLGIPNTTLFFGLWFVAAPYILPGETAVVVYTFPLWVTLLAGPLLGERWTATAPLALAAGFVGVALVARVWMLQAAAPLALPVLALLGGAIAWAVGTVLIQRRFRAPDMVEVNALQLVGGSIGLAVAAAVVEGVPTSASPSSLLVIALYLGLVGTAFAYGVWFWLLGRIPAGELSRYVFLVPVVALLASIAFLGERLDLGQFVGVALVVVAVYLTGRARVGRSVPRTEGDLRAPD
jgi:drug/metabolite transporter (DMT)-like permease